MHNVKVFVTGTVDKGACNNTNFGIKFDNEHVKTHTLFSVEKEPKVDFCGTLRSPCNRKTIGASF